MGCGDNKREGVANRGGQMGKGGVGRQEGGGERREVSRGGGRTLRGGRD